MRPDYQMSQLDVLEAEAIHIMREVAAEFERPALLFSGGKDSIVMLALAEKAFWPARIPFPVMHVDTGHNFQEVLDFRDRRVNELGVQLLVASVPEAIENGLVHEPPDGTHGPGRSVRKPVASRCTLSKTAVPAKTFTPARPDGYASSVASIT
jgi:sulfate adenylyltransferase subunit 2